MTITDWGMIKPSFFYLTTIALLGLLLPVSPARAEQPDKIVAAPTASGVLVPAPDSGCDIVILMDSSGSMKHTDPKNYRKDAAKLFVSLLGADDRISIMSFGDSARLLKPLTQNSPENRKDFFNAIDRISSREFSTNITDAVLKGFQLVREFRHNRRILILMSDGRLALGSPEKDVAALAALTRILPEAAKEGIRLYTVAFTSESDHSLLENMARATGGFFRYAQTDTDVHVIFTSIFEKIKSPDTVPFHGETFSIDKKIQEATVLVTKKAGTAIALMDPRKQKNTALRHAKNMQWYESKVFDMVTIHNPEVGAWRVKFSTNEGNKVFVVTNLSLKSSFDGSFMVRGKPLSLDAWLEKEDGVIIEQELLQNTTFSAELAEPDKTVVKLDLAPASSAGKYATSFVPATAGDYTIKVIASGKTFQREKVFQFKAAEPPVPAAPAPAIEEPKTQPTVSTLPAPVEDVVSWTSVLVKFAWVNLALIVIAAGLYGGIALYRKKTTRQKTTGKGRT